LLSLKIRKDHLFIVFYFAYMHARAHGETEVKIEETLNAKILRFYCRDGP
jgi:hypothetical protein